MAKHPHMIALIEGRTWKCMLDGCAFFVHMGLAHVLVGKRTVCYECHEEFVMSVNSLNVAKNGGGHVICSDCIDNLVQQNIASKMPQKPKQTTIKTASGMEITRADGEPVQHTRECSVWHTDICDCGAE